MAKTKCKREKSIGIKNNSIVLLKRFTRHTAHRQLWSRKIDWMEFQVIDNPPLTIAMWIHFGHFSTKYPKLLMNVSSHQWMQCIQSWTILTFNIDPTSKRTILFRIWMCLNDVYNIGRLNFSFKLSIARTLFIYHSSWFEVSTNKKTSTPAILRFIVIEQRREEKNASNAFYLFRHSKDIKWLVKHS